MACPLFKMKGPALVPDSGRAHPPAFPLKHQQKDLRLALALGPSRHTRRPSFPKGRFQAPGAPPLPASVSARRERANRVTAGCRAE